MTACAAGTSRRMFFLIVFPFAYLHEGPEQPLPNRLPLALWLLREKSRKENVLPSNDPVAVVSLLYYIPVV